MKTWTLFVFSFFFFLSLNALAQTPKTIEADLYKSYQKIGYWALYRGEHRDSTQIEMRMRAEDSLDRASNLFGEKLKYYTRKYPFTIKQKFNSIAQQPGLPDDQVKILTSTDGLFRIYSWDTRSDGTMYGFENCIQYKTGSKTKSMLITDTASDHMDRYVYYYFNLYTLKANNKTYYMAVYRGIYCSLCVGEGIQVFAIEDGKLNDDVKLIRTHTGLHSQLYYEYDFGSVAYKKVRPEIYFDAVTKTIHMPLIAENEKMTHKYITYKFTGRYFEKVKS